jgi:hypothetical protein
MPRNDVHTVCHSTSWCIDLLKFTLLLVVVVSMGAGLHWMLSVSGSLQDLVEQYFVALTLLVLIPLVMPERK